MPEYQSTDLWRNPTLGSSMVNGAFAGMVAGGDLRLRGRALDHQIGMDNRVQDETERRNLFIESLDAKLTDSRIRLENSTVELNGAMAQYNAAMARNENAQADRILEEIREMQVKFGLELHRDSILSQAKYGQLLQDASIGYGSVDKMLESEEGQSMALGLLNQFASEQVNFQLAVSSDGTMRTPGVAISQDGTGRIRIAGVDAEGGLLPIGVEEGMTLREATVGLIGQAQRVSPLVNQKTFMDGQDALKELSALELINGADPNAERVTDERLQELRDRVARGQLAQLDLAKQQGATAESISALGAANRAGYQQQGRDLITDARTFAEGEEDARAERLRNQILQTTSRAMSELLPADFTFRNQSNLLFKRDWDPFTYGDDQVSGLSDEEVFTRGSTRLGNWVARELPAQASNLAHALNYRDQRGEYNTDPSRWTDEQRSQAVRVLIQTMKRPERRDRLTRENVGMATVGGMVPGVGPAIQAYGITRLLNTDMDETDYIPSPTLRDIHEAVRTVGTTR